MKYWAGVFILFSFAACQPGGPPVLRAAADHLQPPRRSKVDGAFVDGGASPYNDPSLQLLMLAALDGHGLRWQTGRGKILLISVGTGSHKKTHGTEKLMDMKVVEQGLRSLVSLMDDCTRMNHVMMQWLTRCLTPWTLDRAVWGITAMTSVRGTSSRSTA